MGKAFTSQNREFNKNREFKHNKFLGGESYFAELYLDRAFSYNTLLKTNEVGIIVVSLSRKAKIRM